MATISFFPSRPDVRPIERSRSAEPVRALAFPEIGTFDTLFERLKRAIGRGDMSAALDNLSALGEFLDEELQQVRPGLLDRDQRWSAEEQWLCERMRKRYGSLARTGTVIVQSLTEQLGAEHGQALLARAHTLKNLNEAAKWELMFLAASAKLVCDADDPGPMSA